MTQPQPVKDPVTRYIPRPHIVHIWFWRDPAGLGIGTTEPDYGELRQEVPFKVIGQQYTALNGKPTFRVHLASAMEEPPAMKSEDKRRLAARLAEVMIDVTGCERAICQPDLMDLIP